MKLARLALGTQTVLCRIEGDAAYPLQIDTNVAWADPLRMWLANGRPAHSGVTLPVSGATFLSPVRAPSKIVAVGLNYRDHAKEQGKELPTAPMLFSKAPSALCGPDDDIVFSPTHFSAVDYEAELAVIIGQTMAGVAAAEALDYVFGYTMANDVTARDAQLSDGQFFRAKSANTFCPLGPFIVTADEMGDVTNLGVRCSVNGELRQNGTTADMVFSVAEALSYISMNMTLEPGDVVLTGTPAGVGAGRQPQQFLANGDVVEIEIDHLGTLRNTVRA